MFDIFIAHNADCQLNQTQNQRTVQKTIKYYILRIFIANRILTMAQNASTQRNQIAEIQRAARDFITEGLLCCYVF